MLYFTLFLGIFITIWAVLTISSAWTQANVWIVPLGVVCVAIGALMEALRHDHAKRVIQNQKRPLVLPAGDRARIVQEGFLSMLLAACFIVLGLILLTLQGMAFFSNGLDQNPFVQVRPDHALPKLELSGSRAPSTHVYSKEFSFTEDWFTYNIPIWEQALMPYKGKPRLRYLEIGVFEGRSFFWMLENILTDPTSSAVAMDIFTGEFRNRYYANLKLSGCEHRVTTITGYSQIELRNQQLESFDIIYVDGSHKAGNVLEDAVLCLRLLKHGGVLIFDDAKWTGWKKVESPENNPRPAIDIFYAFYGKQFETIHNGYQVMLRKK